MEKLDKLIEKDKEINDKIVEFLESVNGRLDLAIDILMREKESIKMLIETLQK